MGLSTTYTKVETDYLLQKLQKFVTSGIKGILKITDTAPTEKGLYILTDVGTYTNLGGLITTVDKLNYAYFDGTTWSKVEVALDLTNYVKENDVKEIVGIEPQINIADLSKIKTGFYFNYVNGNTYALSGYNALGLYKIEANTEYKVPATYTDQTAFFDIFFN